MSYNMTEWKTGDIVTADKLNNIENGIANVSDGVELVINISNPQDAEWTPAVSGEMQPTEYYTVTIDKTIDEILDAMQTGQEIIAKQSILKNNATDVIFYHLERESGFEYSGLKSGIIRLSAKMVNLIRPEYIAMRYNALDIQYSCMDGVSSLDEVHLTVYDLKVSLVQSN